MKCPHKLIQFCPLYCASHTGRGNGCDDGTAGEGTCAVDNGKDYGRLVADMVKNGEADLVRERAEAENRHYSKEQRRRNMRAAGLN